MRRKIVMTALFLVAGCSSGFSQFYYDIANRAPVEKLTSEPQVYGGSDDREQDILRMFEDGYALIGESAFNGALEGEAGAREQARKVGAHTVLLYSEFTNSQSGVVPFTTVRPVTTVQSGTLSTYGVGPPMTGTYSGTSTAYVPQTAFIPYNVRRYDQAALYFARMGPSCLGAWLSDASAKEMRAAGTNKVIRIDAVRRGAPAYEGDLIPGDLLVTINGKPVDVDADTFGASGETLQLGVMRRRDSSGGYEKLSIDLKLGVCE